MCHDKGLFVNILRILALDSYLVMKIQKTNVNKPKRSLLNKHKLFIKGSKGIYRTQIINVEKEKNEDLFSSHRLFKKGTQTAGFMSPKNFKR